VEDTFDGGEAVFEEVSNLLDDTQAVAIYPVKCIEMVAEKADVSQDQEAAGHGMAFGPIRAGIVAWDAPTALN
jgi:hypothetical protein